MTQVERNDVGRAWTMVAQVYGKHLAPETIRLMVDAIEDLPPPAILSALKNWVRVTKRDRHPFPSEIREVVHPEPDARFVALDAARRIDRALSRHGYVWEVGYAHSNGGHYWEPTTSEGAVLYHWTFKEAVLAELGEIGWHAICSRGGWRSLCTSQREMDEGQFVAQLRDQVQASYSLAKQGVDVTRIELPDSRRSQSTQVESASNVIELMRYENGS